MNISTLSKSQLITAIVRSVTITSIISCLFGGIFILLDKSFFHGFLFGVIGQIIFGYSFNSYFEWKDRKFAEILETEKNKIYTPVNLSCAYCNTQNRVPISLLNSNVFKCVSCNQGNKLYIKFTTVRLTTPLFSKDGQIIDEDENLEDSISHSTINDPITITK